MVLPKNILLYVLLGAAAVGALGLWGASASSGRRARLAAERLAVRLAEEEAATAGAVAALESAKREMALAKLEVAQAQEAARRASREREVALSRLADVPSDAPCQQRLTATEDALAATELEREAVERAMLAGRRALASCGDALVASQSESATLRDILEDRDVALLKEESAPRQGWIRRHFGCAVGPSLAVSLDGDAAIGVGVACGWKF